MKTYKLPTYLLTLLLASVQASEMANQKFNINKSSLETEQEEFELQEGIATYLPGFFKKNEEMLEELQEGKYKAVLVIGQTDAGKSTLIGSLLGHRFLLEEKKIQTVKNGTESMRERKILVNKSQHAPKIGYNPVNPETIFTQVYLDKDTRLAFIDTAGLGNVSKDGNAINLCNAVGLHSLIEAIGRVKCIIGVIQYERFKAGKGSNTFVNLLTITSSLLKNTSPETVTSSIILAFTKVPSKITKKDIHKAIEDRCNRLDEKKKNKEMTEEDKVVEGMYKILFPSCYGLEDKQNVPFFLISEESILQQGLVRNNMLRTLQDAKQVDSKDIGLVLQPSLLQKIIDWLAERAKSIANDIRRKEYTEQKITYTKKHLLFNQKQLSKNEQLLNSIKDSNNKEKKESFKKCLKETIQRTIERIEELDVAIEHNKKEQEDTDKAISIFDSNKIILHMAISGIYNKNTKKYSYSYNNANVPINHIIYNDGTNKNYKTKDPKPGDRVSDNYKIVAMAKNYNQGMLDITLENNISGNLLAMAGAGTIASFGITGLVFAPLLTAMKCVSPDLFYIYAKKKHIYHSHINTLRNDVQELQKVWFQMQKNKKRLEKEVQRSRFQLEQLQSDSLTKEDVENNGFDNPQLQQIASNFLHDKAMIEQVKTVMKAGKEEVKNIESNLQIQQILLDLLNKNLKKNEIVPCIITHVHPFIDFHNNCKHDIDICKQYYRKVLKKPTQGNNSNANKKHSDYEPDVALEQKEDGDGDSNKISPVVSSVLLGTTVLSSILLKEKN